MWKNAVASESIIRIEARKDIRERLDRAGGVKHGGQTSEFGRGFPMAAGLDAVPKTHENT